MPVTIKTADHEANIISPARGCNYPKAILNKIEPERGIGDLLHSSLENEVPPVLIANNNGFVNAATEAFNHHHHLVVRPDDVWLAILTQFSSYVHGHAEELKSCFVAHEGQKTLRVVYNGADRYSLDFADFALRTSNLIDEYIIDPELRNWITPAFGTSTRHDVVIASVVMMGMLQSYLQHGAHFMCGIPSVTLLGEKSDYEMILTRVEKLEQYRDEPSEFGRLLRPILNRFIRTFDEPNNQDIIQFWRSISSKNGRSDPPFYNGWISAFCFWDSEGRRQLSSQSRLREELEPHRNAGVLRLDGIYYPGIESDKIPPGYVTLPVEINDHGTIIKAEMLSGSVGINCASSGSQLPSQSGIIGIDTMQPYSAWFVYEKGSEGDGAQDTSAPSAETVEKIDLLVKELNSLVGVRGRDTE